MKSHLAVIWLLPASFFAAVGHFSDELFLSHLLFFSCYQLTPYPHFFGTKPAVFGPGMGHLRIITIT